MMTVAKVVSAIFIRSCLWVLLVSSLNVNCLRSLKSQLKDPNAHLANWVFGNYSEGYICSEDNKVLSIEFPSGVKSCSSMQTLNLTGNNLSGILPSHVFSFLPYLVTLHLSHNNFSPSCLIITGSRVASPSGIASSPRLRQFSVAHNHLQGSIPELINGSIFFSVPVTAQILSNIAAAALFPVGACFGWFYVGEEQKQRPRRR